MKFLILALISLLQLSFSANSAIIDKSMIQKNLKKADAQRMPVLKFKYRILPPGKLAEERKRVITQASRDWENVTKVKFEFYSELDQLEPDFFIDIHTSEEDNRSRFSRGAHGLVDYRAKKMALNMPADSSLAEIYSLALHELGHILGFDHEHQHPERPFTFDLDYLVSKCLSAMSEADCRNSINYNSIRVSKESFAEMSSYDSTSIMHYPVSRPSVIEDMATPQNSRLSLLDKLTVSKAYGSRVSEEDIREQHALEDEQMRIGLSGNCKLEFNRFYSRFQYIYPNGTAARFLEKTPEGAFVNARLDPKCSQ